MQKNLSKTSRRIKTILSFLAILLPAIELATAQINPPPPNGGMQPTGTNPPPAEDDTKPAGTNPPPPNGGMQPTGTNPPPAEDDTKPAGTNPPPAEDDTKPAGTNPPPAEDDTKPVATNPPPAEGDTKPAGTNPPLAEDDTKPAGTNPPPAEDDTKPAGANPLPAEDDTKPAGANPLPAEDDTKPAGTNPPPAEDDTKPAGTNPPPAEDDTKPAGTNPSPAEDDTKPAGTNPSPAEDDTQPTGNNSQPQNEGSNKPAPPPPEEIAGYNADTLHQMEGDVIKEFEPDDVKAINEEEFKKMSGEEISRWFTHLDSEKVQPEDVAEMVPPGWELDQVTGEIKPPKGTKIALPTVTPPTKSVSTGDAIIASDQGNNTLVPPPPISESNVALPEMSDLQVGLGIGGRGTPILEQVNDSLQKGGWGKLVPQQDENGIVRVTDTTATDVKEYALIADSDRIEWTGEQNSQALSTDEQGFYQVTTEEGLKVSLLPAPKDIDSVAELIGGGKVRLGKGGDVWMKPSKETKVSITTEQTLLPEQNASTEEELTIGMFDAAVGPAPGGFAPGLHLPTDPTEDHGWMVYEDGTGQRVNPTFPEPDAFVAEGLKFEGIEAVEQNVDGTFSIVVEGKFYVIKPQFGSKSRELAEDETAETHIAVNADGTITYSVVVEEETVEDTVAVGGQRKLRGWSRKVVDTSGEIDEPEA